VLKVGDGASIFVVVGNPRKGSRTLHVASALAQRLTEYLGFEAAPTTLDLADYAARLFDDADDELLELTDRMAGSRLTVVASPTYKATYTGLLKVFLDRHHDNALAATLAVPLMVGGWPLHALAPEVHLRAVLVELGAAVPTRALYVTESQLGELDEVFDGWLAQAGPRLQGWLSNEREATR
jgi:FMN reductase